ncbi:MAG: 16S rRNA (cytosine(1402)-N(4))-methyltransferase RsmH [Candidatus Wallbacteria bacterium]|nr:16S rRNA (cytosine(1402)-N(4))-methyltransferase RsmH [Candidatus Wallbacteria bacterium]
MQDLREMTRASLDGNAQGPEPRAEDRRPALHQPVLLAEVLELFAGCARPRVVVDGTVGLGGHSAAMLEARGSEIEILIGVDRDPEALAMARDRMKAVGAKTSLLLQQGSYICIPKLLQDEEIPGADFVLLDLGVSTYQLKTPRRGFSLIADGPLDMRMDPGHGSTAAELLERATATELESWLRHYGEVRQAGRIARALWERRSTLRTTGALAAAVLDALRLRRPPPGEIHPATQVFQALRIAVNCELDDLDAVLPDTLQRLAPEGRFAVISFSARLRAVESLRS